MDNFTHLVSSLHAWHKIPMVHSRSVDRSTSLPIVSTRPILSGPAKLDDIFVSTNSPLQSFAGRAHRVHFHDHETNQYAEVDVLLCDERACAVCNVGDLPASEAVAVQRSQSRPVISEKGVVMVPGHGLTFQPRDQVQEPHSPQTGSSYPSHVVFTGGKRVVVDVVYQPAADEATPRRLDILDFLS
jgi:hypothetical protein